MTHLTARLNRTATVDAIIDTLASQKGVHFAEDAAECAFTVAARIASVLRDHSTPVSLQALRNALADGYGDVNTLSIVAEIVTSPDGRCWGADGRVMQQAAAEEHRFTPAGQAQLLKRVITLLAAQPPLDTAPITDGHAWWIAKSDKHRLEILEELVDCDRECRETAGESFVVFDPVKLRDVTVSLPWELLPTDMHICAYLDGKPTDGIGMPDVDAARMSICAALGIA